MTELRNLEAADFGPLTMASLARSNKEPTTSMVYFVADLEARQVKIGRAINPRARLAALQAGSTHELTLMGVLSGGSELEGELHERFAADRVRGEWFRFSRELSRLIRAAYEAGTGKPFISSGRARERGVASGDKYSKPRTAKPSPAVNEIIREFAEVMGIAEKEARQYIKQLLAEDQAH